MQGRSNSPDRKLPAPTREQIAALAYAIWKDRGCPEGTEVDNWLEAERQLQTGAAAPASSVQNHIPATPGDPDRDPAVDGSTVEQELDRVTRRPGQRSPTTL